MFEGSASWTTSPVEPLTFALRASGKTTWGKYPAHEAAYLGGSRTVRSLDAQRFAGDAAVWANFETRLRVGTLPFVMRWDWGVFGIADAGRVYYSSESSSRVHYGLGGGLWAVLPDRSFMGVFDVVAGDDNKVAFWFGIAFIM
jgi:hemolysin activation/secretion protein